MDKWREELSNRGVTGVLEMIFDLIDHHALTVADLDGRLKRVEELQSQGAIDHGQSNASSDGLRDSPVNDPDSLDDGERGHTGSEELSGGDTSTTD